MTLLGIQLFGWEIDTTLFVFEVTALGGFAWWLTAMYYNLKSVRESNEAIKEASLKRGRQTDILMIKNEALTETLGTEGIQLGRKFKQEYDKTLERKIEEYKIEVA